MSKITSCLASALLLTSVNTVMAQSLPASQPNFLQIYREEVKLGHSTDHAKVEAGWPAAFEKAKSPYTYIALASLTGPQEVWFVSPFESQQAMADSMASEEEPGLAATLEKLTKADAEHLSGARGILARARKDLSHGAYPDTASQRFYQITVWRIRPGRETSFDDVAKAYGAAMGRTAPNASFRVYQVMAGMPSPTYLVFTSVTSYGAFDKMLSENGAAMKAATAEERATMEKFSTDALVSTDTIRLRLDPAMSYVPKEVRAADPAFWSPKPAAAAAKPAPKAEVKK
ncbi:MAG: hypothetical protein WCP29_10615 [Acidobacteriota bacterium]